LAVGVGFLLLRFAGAALVAGDRRLAEFSMVRYQAGRKNGSGSRPATHQNALIHSSTYAIACSPDRWPPPRALLDRIDKRREPAAAVPVRISKHCKQSRVCVWPMTRAPPPCRGRPSAMPPINIPHAMLCREAEARIVGIFVGASSDRGADPGPEFESASVVDGQDTSLTGS